MSISKMIGLSAALICGCVLFSAWLICHRVDALLAASAPRVEKEQEKLRADWARHEAFLLNEAKYDYSKMLEQKKEWVQERQLEELVKIRAVLLPAKP